MAADLDERTLFEEEIYPQLQKVFPSCIIDANSSWNQNKVVLRAAINSSQDAEMFKNHFSQITSTEWIVYWGIPNGQRLIYSKTWVCQHHKLHKASDSTKRNANCNAEMKIIIKKVTKHTKKKDGFLKLCPPLSGKIIISLQHSHDTLSAESLTMLRVNEEVKQKYFDYFSIGLMPANAMKFHENSFLIEKDYESLQNSSINPTSKQVYYFYKIWKAQNFGRVINPVHKSKKKLPFNKSDERFKSAPNKSPIVPNDEVHNLQQYVASSFEEEDETNYDVELISNVEEKNYNVEINYESEETNYDVEEINYESEETSYESEETNYESEETNYDAEETTEETHYETEEKNHEDEETTYEAEKTNYDDAIKDEFKRISELLKNSKNGNKKGEKMLNILKNIKTVEDLESFSTVQHFMQRTGIQPTSIARRRPGLPRNSHQISSDSQTSAAQTKKNHETCIIYLKI